MWVLRFSCTAADDRLVHFGSSLPDFFLRVHFFALIHYNQHYPRFLAPFAFLLKGCRLSSAFCCETLSGLSGDYTTSMELAFKWVFIVARLFDHGIVDLLLCRLLYDGALSCDCAGFSRPPSEEA